MRGLGTSKASGLRVLAETFRRRASEMTLARYVKLMRHTADDLEAEATAIELDQPIVSGRHIDIVV